MANLRDDGSELEATRNGVGSSPKPFSQFPPAPQAPEDVDLATVSVLRALLGCTGPEEALIVAVDQSGFPLAQARIPRPDDLPAALVLGRHHRCGLVLASDPDLRLRHLLLVILPGPGPLRIRAVPLHSPGDLGQNASPALPDSLGAQGHLFLDLASTRIFVLPGGPVGLDLLEGDPGQTLESLRNNPTLDYRSGFRPKLPPLTHPGGALPYRQDPRLRYQHQGILRLRGDSDERGRVPHRDHELRPEALHHGLLIGRHAERCSLAGEARNLSRIHALVCQESEESLWVFDLASTNGVRPKSQAQGPSHSVVRLTSRAGCLLGQFHLDWLPQNKSPR